MANKNMFSNHSTDRGSATVQKADTRNPAGGLAYKLSPRQALAQIAAVSMMGNSFYQNSEEIFNALVVLASHPDNTDEFIAKAAIYARQNGYMKDTAAILTAMLHARKSPYFEQAFNGAIDSPRVLRTFVQIVRSGRLGRTSLGATGKRAISGWFNRKSPHALIRGSVGNDPSLHDVIYLAHPKPENAEKGAVIGYLAGKVPGTDEQLPSFIRQYEKFRAKPGKTLPEGIPFRMLTDLELTDAQWRQIGYGMSITELVYNLSTLDRHNAFKDEAFVEHVVERLMDHKAIADQKIMPHTLMNAYFSGDAPMAVKGALDHAIIMSLDNIPYLGENIVIAVDVSGSMVAPINGQYASFSGSGRVVRAIDVASLFAAAIRMRYPNAKILQFDTSTRELNLNLSETISGYIEQVAVIGGGTDCSSPIKKVAKAGFPVDTFLMLSDNMSWAGDDGRYGATGAAEAWNKIVENNPHARFIGMDLATSGTTQVPSMENVLHIGGFTGSVFDVIGAFVNSRDPNAFVSAIDEISLS